MRSKLHFDEDARPFSKSTSRITEVISDIAPLPKEDEDTYPIPEDPSAIVQSEGVVKCKLSTLKCSTNIFSNFGTFRKQM